MTPLAKELRRRNRKDFSPSAYLAAPIGTDGAVSYSTGASTGQIDEAERSVGYVICTADEDREGDIIDPRGCLDYIDDYKKNPVVLYEHNAEAGAIGLARDKVGRFYFDVQSDRIISKCFFHCRPFKGENLSHECFELAKAGVLLGASIGFLPVESQKRAYGKGFKFNSWRLTEYSLTFQPVNAGTLSEDVLRMSLSKGIIKSLTLKQSVESLLPPAKVWSSGVDLSGRGTRDKSMKPKIHTIFCDGDVFNANAATIRVQLEGYRTDRPIESPGVFAFAQRDGAVIPGSRKSLGKGIWATLTKSKADDEDEDDKDGETPDFVKDKVEKADAEDDDTDKTEDEDTAEVPEEAEVAADEDNEEAEDKDAESEETQKNDANPEEIKAQAQDLANVIAHFEALVDHLPEMGERAAGAPHADIFTKIHADAEALIADLDEIFGKNFASVARAAMVENPEQDNSGANTQAGDATETMGDEEQYKSLKPYLTKLDKSLTMAV